jgi:hypothetical protein
MPNRRIVQRRIPSRPTGHPVPPHGTYGEGPGAASYVPPHGTYTVPRTVPPHGTYLDCQWRA